jgi:sulfur-carrier protein
MIRIVLPYHLYTLARVNKESQLEIDGKATIGAVLDSLETQFPMLRGTIRDQSTYRRRPFLRFFACGQDFSLEPLDTLLPDAVINGEEPFMIVGAMAGG